MFHTRDTAIPGEWNEADRFHYRFQDCRYLLVFHNAEGVILKIALVRWEETCRMGYHWDSND